MAAVYTLFKDSFKDLLHEFLEAETDATLGYEKIVKMISLYACEMSTRDIHDHLQELYGIKLSAEIASKITDKILPEVKE